MSRIQITTHRSDRAASPHDGDTADIPLPEALIPELDRQMRSALKPSRVELDSNLADSEHDHGHAGREHRAHRRGGPGHGGHEAHESHRGHRPHGGDFMARREPRAQAPVEPTEPTLRPAVQPAPVAPPAPAPVRRAAPQPAPAVAATTAPPAPSAPSPALRMPSVSTVAEAAGTVVPKFKPVLRGDEAAKDAAILTQADFARAVDQTALDYGLNPQVFRAQLQVESGALTNDFRQAMKHEGDLDRAGDNNTSIGIGQISRKFLDGREWSDGGPGNPRVGSQVVTTEQYLNSATVQIRMAASNIAQRIADNGGLERGLSYYVSGNAEPNANGQSYIAKINERLKDPAVVGI